MPTETITFEFTATRTDGSGRTIEIAVTVEDDGSPMVDLEEDAEERAHVIARKKLGTQEVEIISENAF